MGSRSSQQKTVLAKGREICRDTGVFSKQQCWLRKIEGKTVCESKRVCRELINSGGIMGYKSHIVAVEGEGSGGCDNNGGIITVGWENRSEGDRATGIR